MLRSGRNHVTEVVLGLILAFTAGTVATGLDYRGDYQERYPSYADGTSDAQPTPANANGRVGTSRNKTPCQQAQSREESELCAQWRAASAGKQAARWALWQLFLSVFGVVGLGLTLWFNKRAIDIALESGEDTERALIIAAKNAAAASRAAVAATKQVAIAQETAYRELRAYLSVEVVPLPSSPGILTGHVIIKNAGQTPAQIRVFVRTMSATWPFDPLKTGVEPTEDIHHHPYINRGGADKVQWFYPDEGDAAEDIAEMSLVKSQKVLIVYGRVEFSDYMRRERVLHFSFRNNGPLSAIETFEMVATPTGNHYEERGKQA